MFRMRRGMMGDYDFLYRVDVEDEGISVDFKAGWGEREWEALRARIRGLLCGEGAATFVAEEEMGRRVGVICGYFRNVDGAGEWFAFPAGEGFLPREVYPADGRYCEVYQLWVDPAHRRRGLGSALKRELERECVRRGVGMIYTHTERANAHVVALNEKLGYRVVRVGPIWDEVERVSLVKAVNVGGRAEG